MFGIYFPWGRGIGTLGIKLGRFYSDLFWSDWPRDFGEVLDSPARLMPAGIYLRAPWFQFRGRIVGGGQYYLRFRQFWRGFRRKR